MSASVCGIKTNCMPDYILKCWPLAERTPIWLPLIMRLHEHGSYPTYPLIPQSISCSHPQPLTAMSLQAVIKHMNTGGSVYRWYMGSKSWSYSVVKLIRETNRALLIYNDHLECHRVQLCLPWARFQVLQKDIQVRDLAPGHGYTVPLNPSGTRRVRKRHGHVSNALAHHEPRGSGEKWGERRGGKRKWSPPNFDSNEWKHISDKPGGRSDPKRLTGRQRQIWGEGVCHSGPSGLGGNEGWTRV